MQHTFHNRGGKAVAWRILQRWTLKRNETEKSEKVICNFQVLRRGAGGHISLRPQIQQIMGRKWRDKSVQQLFETFVCRFCMPLSENLRLRVPCFCLTPAQPLCCDLFASSAVRCGDEPVTKRGAQLREWLKPNWENERSMQSMFAASAASKLSWKWGCFLSHEILHLFLSHARPNTASLKAFKSSQRCNLPTHRLYCW